ncbi:MAG: long-chain fatty acid--CoA ligase, partial [Hyphococcus sp.]
MSNPTKKNGPAQIDDRRAKLFDAARPLLPGILSLHEKWLGETDALICDDSRLSWSAFGEATNRVANGLRALGLQPGDTVGVVMQNSPEMIETLFGVMKAGCVSAPLNLTVSDDALTGMLIDADVRAVVASSDQIARLDKCCADERLKDVVRIGCPHGDGCWLAYGQWKQQQNAASPQVAIAPDDILNIIYSSGTTGRPKGIVHTHQTRLDWAYDLAIALRYHNAARAICTLSLYSNISWVMLLCTLLAGGTLIVSRKFDAAAFLDAVARHKATHTALVPVQLQRILDHPDFSLDKVASMQAIMSCGSPLHESLKRRVFEGFPCGVIELYGLTEGVITTLQPEEAEGRMSSVGKPLLGT